MTLPLDPDWIVPDWPVPPHVHAVCTTRSGGVSKAPWDSMNLGDHVQDDPLAVAANRDILYRAIGVRPVFLEQVHGVAVQPLDATTPDGTTADACVAEDAGVACAILVADCLPVLLTNRQGSVIGAAHAGWRGLAGTEGSGVLEALVQQMAARTRARAAEGDGKAEALADVGLLAWLGPCIGPQVFEVGPEVRAAFCDADPDAAPHFRAHVGTKFLADLAGLARRRLQRLGISAIYGNDGSAGWCTVSNPSRFFSYRRDQVALGGSGRLAACIWLG